VTSQINATDIFLYSFLMFCNQSLEHTARLHLSYNFQKHLFTEKT